MSIYSRLYDFLAGATVRSQEFDDEFNAIALFSQTTLRAVDAVSVDLPNAATRANKLLSFDASGQPQASNSVPDPVADTDAANKRWVQTLALSATIPVTGGDAGRLMGNNGSVLQWTAAPTATLAYDNRANLRSMTGDALQAWQLVEGLGLFQHFVGSPDGPDDDETAFATASGCWLLICPTWDVVDAYTLLDRDYQDNRLVSAESRLTAAEVFTSKMFRATSTQSAFTLSINSSTTFTVTVTGAVAGASVIVTPPSSPTLNTITVFAWVSASNTVTVYIGNANSSLTGGFGAGDWQITVINK